MGSISIREHIRWLPDPPSEPTSTIVLTSPENRFVDVRVLCPAGENATGISALSDLDWAIAGTSSSVPLESSDVAGARHSTWRHWIDSRITVPDGVADEGDCFPRPECRVLETGRMVNPATGRETDYEEVWRDEEPGPVDPQGLAPVVVLQIEDDSRQQRGLVVRLGRICQALLRQGEALTVERWHFTGDRGWEKTVGIGSGSIPCGIATREEKGLQLGQEVREGHLTWTVVERSDQ